MQAQPRDRAILLELASGQPVSGQVLAQRLGLSRAAIWKRVSALREMGLPVQARTGTGYQLPWPVELLDMDRLAAGLHQPHLPLHLHWELDSTQDELARLLPGAPDLSTVIAERQTRGRGRRGRHWQSPPGLGIYVSCLKHFSGGPTSLGGLSVAMGICLAQTLLECGLPHVQLKWPNDILQGGSKLAGVLIELSGEAEGPSTARVGLGLIMRRVPGAAAAPNEPATDLITGFGANRAPGRNELAARLINALRSGLQRFAQHGVEPFVPEFSRLDALLDQPLWVQDGEGKPTRATGRGINAHGHLMVEDSNGLRALDGGQVVMSQ